MRYRTEREGQKHTHHHGRIYIEEAGFLWRHLYGEDFVWDGETPFIAVERDNQTGREVYLTLAVIGDPHTARRLLVHFNEVCAAAESPYWYRLRE